MIINKNRKLFEVHVRSIDGVIVYPIGANNKDEALHNAIIQHELNERDVIEVL